MLPAWRFLWPCRKPDDCKKPLRSSGPEARGRRFFISSSPLPLGGEGPGGEGVNAVKPETTQRRRQRRSLARSEVQIGRARELRRNQTESEEVAWRLLRTLRFNGFKFRRQHAVGRYIVDFCCPQRRLIVELDGSVHAQPSQIKRDTSRDAELKRTRIHRDAIPKWHRSGGAGAVSGESAGRRVVIAKCFHRRVVTCKRTGAGS